MKKLTPLILLSICLALILPAPSGSAAKYPTSKAKSKLTDIRKVDKSIVIDLRYATKKNFTKKKIYPAPKRNRKEAGKSQQGSEKERISD